MRAASTAGSTALVDRRGRALRDLRISVTDRCNFRCGYCMPAEVFGRDYAFLPVEELLTFDEITRLARIAARHGVEKIRLTGGEPLLRAGLPELIAMLSEIRTPEGASLDLAVTTNGSALGRLAPALAQAGLRRVTVSLDSLDDATFRAMNGDRCGVETVLQAIAAAHDAGLSPIKINMVVRRGVNDADVVAMAEHFRGTPHILRFIEYMDVGTTNGWRLDEVVPSAEVISRIDSVFPLEPIAADRPGATSTRWRYRDGRGEIGVISSVTQAFCHSCTRARISARGELFTCLFAASGRDLRKLLRSGRTDDELSEVMAGIWRTRDDRYSELRTSLTASRLAPPQRVEMSYIGG